MELLTRLPTFLLAVLLIAAVPGPAFALIVRRSTLGGFRAAVPVVLGTEVGLYFWIIAAGAGLAALVAASHVAFLVLRVTSAVVLVTLGVRAWLSARRGGADWSPETADLPSLPGRTPRGGFAVGAITNLANPKAAVFTFAVYPQFIPHGYPTLATTAGLGLLQISIETLLYLALAKAVSRASRWLGKRARPAGAGRRLRLGARRAGLAGRDGVMTSAHAAGPELDR